MVTMAPRILLNFGLLVLMMPLFSCVQPAGDPEALDDEARQTKRRQWMVKAQLASRDIKNERVLAAMRNVPRHRFVPEPIREHAYEDRALAIGSEQTISQPYIVALMTQLADPKPGDRALDIGTGSGYQAAVLAGMVKSVHSIEIVPELAAAARDRLKSLGYENVEVREGDGYRGWPDQAPFDIIILAAAPPEVPPALLDQLALGGRLVLPVGAERGAQQLLLIKKDHNGELTREVIAPVAFVPMTGEAQDNGKHDEE